MAGETNPNIVTICNDSPHAGTVRVASLWLPVRKASTVRLVRRITGRNARLARTAMIPDCQTLESVNPALQANTATGKDRLWHGHATPKLSSISVQKFF